MRTKFFGFLLFLFGVFLFYINKDITIVNVGDGKIKANDIYENMKYFEGIEFLGVFLNNILVGFLLSILGYFTGGFLTALILVWNGFFVAAVYNIAFYYVSIDTMLYASKHAPIEIYAFLIFAEFGFQGFHFLKKILKENVIDFSLMPKLKKLVLPSLLLFIASILETL